MGKLALAVTMMMVTLGQARAQDPGRMLRRAISDRVVTVAEAQRIVAAVRNATDRAALQRAVDRYADRILPPAEAYFARAGLHNLANPVRVAVRRMPARGVVTVGAMRGALDAIERHGFSPAERRVFHGELAALENPLRSPRPRLTDAAEALARRAETRADAQTKNPYSQRLPVRPGEFNRFHTPAGKPEWPCRAGTPLHDGLGRVRGTLTAPEAKINWGQRKRLLGVWMVYAWDSVIRLPRGGYQRASGWIPESALAHPLVAMPNVEPLLPAGGAMGGRYRITGGDAASFGDARIHPNVRGGGQRATDYLRRDGDVINLLYSTPGAGGVATDTLPVGATFQRATQVQEIRIRLYHPASARPYSISVLTFIYGRADIPGERPRWGWIALRALQRL